MAREKSKRYIDSSYQNGLIELIKDRILKIIKYPYFRQILMFSVIFVMFSNLVVRLYDLQITNGDYYNSEVKGTTLKEIPVTAPRGEIFDRYGRAMATNTTSYAVKIDPSISVDNLNEVILDLYGILEKNNDEIVVSFPITSTLPYAFDFGGSPSKEKRWKADMGLEEDITAEAAFIELREFFDIEEQVSNENAAKILAVRCELYKQRYSKYMPLKIAQNISTKTITTLEENKTSYPGIFVGVDALRSYPYGELFSHLLGYTGVITEAELEAYAENNYTQTDIVGKDGIEKSFELQLNGTDGLEYVEVDSLGRRINTLDESTIAPIPGNNIYLTVDAELQKCSYEALEKALKNVLVNKLTGKSKDFNFTLKELLTSMIESDNIRIKDIMASTEGSQAKIKAIILSRNPDAQGNLETAAEEFAMAYEDGKIAGVDLVLSLYEQGTLTCDEKTMTRIKTGSLSPLSVILSELESGELTPQMTAMDPCTGSVVVTDIENGDVLASVTYPSYDNNELVNNFNNEYYLRLQSDPTTPLVNRPFTEPRAPGSTFKMISAIAGLEEGYITPTSTIHDYGTFKDAGKPYARCWIGGGNGSHGSINVAKALEVSCNYFFYELSYRMGNAKNSKTKEGIETLNKYMRDFGLDVPTGVEIYELYNSRDEYPSNISSPEYKEYLLTLRNPDVTASEKNWYDGDTIRTAIGQAYNNYTSATLSKYVATIANNGTRYSLHFLNKITSYDGKEIEKYSPNVEEFLDVKQENFDIVKKGMYQVTTGTNGTLTGVFEDYPIKVAAKSGTAQQSSKRSEHTIFVAYAPYDNPQIAITVLIPFGDNTTSPAPRVAQEVISAYLRHDDKPETKSLNKLTQ